MKPQYWILLAIGLVSCGQNTNQSTSTVIDSPKAGVVPLNPDTVDQNMPLAIPDTSKQADMPIAKPAPNIQPK